ncbi:MAG: hypothetical protein ACTHKS_10630 [Gaiellaceae bacterium]
MSFFEPLPPPPESPPQPPTPEWFGPPENELPASFPLDVVLTRTDDLALTVHSGRAYGRGFEFTFAVYTRTQHDRHSDPMMGWHEARRTGMDGHVLRFGIAFADGRKATVFDQHHWWGDPENPQTPDIVLSQRGGGGGGKNWDFRFWSWPLLPEGALSFVAEWPSEGVTLVRAEIDSAVVRHAAAHAVTLWPEPTPGAMSGGSWTRMTRMTRSK